MQRKSGRRGKEERRRDVLLCPAGVLLCPMSLRCSGRPLLRPMGGGRCVLVTYRDLRCFVVLCFVVCCVVLLCCDILQTKLSMENCTFILVVIFLLVFHFHLFYFCMYLFYFLLNSLKVCNVTFYFSLLFFYERMFPYKVLSLNHEKIK